MKKLLVWGTGDLAEQFIDSGCQGDIIGFVETVKSKDVFMKKPVYGSREIPEEYDYIVIANSYGTDIYSLCIKLDIDISKLIFLYRIQSRVGCTDAAVLKEVLSEKSYDDYCIRFRLKPKPKQHPREQGDEFVYEDAEKYRKLNTRPTFEIQENNAHRIFYASTIVECFSDMILEEFSVSADGVLESHVEDIHKYDDDESDYRFGLFYFVKK